MGLLLELPLLTLAYWVADHAIRRDGAVRVARRAGFGSLTTQAGVVALAAAAATVWRWDGAGSQDVVRLLGVGIALMLGWKAATKDIDPVVGETHAFARVAVLVCAALGLWSPAFLVASALLLSHPLGVWEHHATMPMRMLQASVAFLALSAASPLVTEELFQDASVLVFFGLTIQISHYLITALAKGYLGPRWYSWVTDNQLHHLAASAYSWGWARFVPWPAWRRVIGALRVVERPMQLFAFTVELLSPLALLDRNLAIAFCLSWSAFHAGVFLTAGLLFWEWIGANLLVAVALWLLPEPVAREVFGPLPVLLACGFLVLFPLRHKLWKPMPLGWWDTPFTQRMRWLAEGESGAVYEVYNDFMCPNERLYGKVHGCFLAPDAVCTYHLGEVWKHELRDALRAAGPDLERLRMVRERFGIHPACPYFADRHRRYLQAFFARLNAGASKSVLPRWLRLLKAPGGQCFYWGDRTPYRRQEPVRRVFIRYYEEYFDGAELRCLQDELVEEIPIPKTPPEAVPEPTPKELDDFLLEHAKGRLLDLPSFGDGYVRTDDGKRASA